MNRALENTSSLESLLAGLRAGAEAELPQNVAVEIREWAALREKITLHRRGRLLEFDRAVARQAAVQSGVEGALVGERFLLLPRLPVGETDLDVLASVTLKRLDYQKPLPRCLSVSETGQVNLKSSQPDLMIEAQVSLWAEARSEGGWQLTQASVSKAVARGGRINELLELFNQRLTHAFPKLLRVILLAWAGEKMSVDLGTLSLLRCPNDQVFQAIVSSKMFKPYLIMQIAPDVLVVDGDQLEMLKERLAWAGFDVGDFCQEPD